MSKVPIATHNHGIISATAPKPQINFFWSGQSLTPHALISLKSFLFHGHQCLLYTDYDITNVPSGVDQREASPILEFTDRYTIKDGFGKDSPAPFADLFRFKLLDQLGGIWSDLDVVCLRSWSTLPPRFIATSLEIPDGDLPNINAIGLVQNDLFAKNWIEIYTTKRDPRDYAFGVKAAKEALAQCPEKPFLAPSAWFNPVSYRNTRFLISRHEKRLSYKKLYRFLANKEPLNIPLPSQSYGLHLWSQMWSANGWSQEKVYSPSTLYGHLQECYL